MKKSHQHCPKVCSSTNRQKQPPAEAAGNTNPPSLAVGRKHTFTY